MPYSAGTVFLEVVPSFYGVQRDVQRQAKNVRQAFAKEVTGAYDDIDARAEKSAQKSTGAFARNLQKRLQQSIKDIGKIEIDADTSEARREMAALLAQAKAFSELNLDVDINAAEAIAQAKILDAEFTRVFRDRDVDIRTQYDAAQARKAMADFIRDVQDRDLLTKREMADRVAAARAAARAEREAAKESRKAQAAELLEAYRMNADFNARKRLQAQAAARSTKETFEDETRALRNELGKRQAMLALARTAEQEAVRRAGVTGDTEDHLAAVAAIRARYQAEEQAAEAAARARIQAAARGTTGEIAAARMAAQAGVEAQKDVAEAARRAAAERVALARLAGSVERAQARSARNAWLEARGASIGQAANSMRLFNGLLLAAVTIGPMLIPVIATLTAGMGFLSLSIMGVVLGLGAMIAGFAGIGGAVQAMAALDRERREQRREGASPGSDAGLRQLRDAQTSLARAQEDAGRRIANAQRQQEASERALTRAVQDAARAQRELLEARQQAAEQLEDMNNRLASGLLDERMSGYRLEEAGYRLNAVLEDDQASQREKEIAQLEYDREVQSIKELQIQNRRLEAEVAEANRKGVEGSDIVVNAKDRIIAANESVIDAERALSEAQSDLARARIEEARTMADAQQRVVDAMVNLRTQSVAAGDAGSAAFNNLEEALLGLSPAGRSFAEFLYELKPLLDDIRFAAQEGLLPGVQEALSTLIDEYGPDFVKSIGEIAKAVGDTFAFMAEQFTNPFWQEFFETMGQMAPGMIRDFGRIIMAVLTGIAGIMQAFAPYADDFSNWLVQVFEAFAEWGSGLDGSDGFASFMDYIVESAPKVGELIGLILEAMLNLAIGLAPYADKLLDLGISFFGWLADLEPNEIAAIAGTIMLIVGAIQALAGVLAVFSGVFNLIGGVLALFGVGPFAVAAAGGGAAAAGGGAAVAGGGAAVAGGAAAASGPVGWIILAIVALIAAIVAGVWWINHLYETSETFRTRVNDTFSAISFIFEGFGEAFDTVFGPIDTFLREVVGPAFLWLWEDVIQPTFSFVSGVFQVFWDTVTTLGNIISQVFTYIIFPVMQELYEKHIKPVWDNYIKPFFDTFGRIIEDDVAPAFQRGLDAIAQIWNGIRSIAAAPIIFVIETVVNKGIIDNFNKLVDIFPGMTKVDHVAIPEALRSGGMPGSRSSSGGSFATGGIMPGYTPGRDVHRFYSPTAGMLELSGGEPVLRPEAGRVLGRRWVDDINRAARTGGTGGVQRFLGGYADGGIIGWLSRGADAVTDVISTVTSTVSELMQDPAGVIRGIVETLVGTGNQGIEALAAGMPLKALDGITAFFGRFFGTDSTGTEPPSGGGGIGYQAMTAILQGAFPNARVSSGYRPGAITAVGTPSYHGKGRAIDIVPPNMGIFNWLSSRYPNSAELLYSPAGAAQILRRGLRGNTAGVTRAMHYDHVHWAYDRGGIIPNLYDGGGALPPGISVVANRTGKPEQVLTDNQWTEIVNNRNGEGLKIVVDGDVNGGEYLMEELADRIMTKQRDALVMSGLATVGVGE